METSVRFDGVPSDKSVDIWPLVRPFVQAALDATPAGLCFDPEHILEKLRKQEMQLWVISIQEEIVAAAITQIIIYPKCRTLDVTFMGGEGYDIWSNEFNDLMRQYGLANHCDYARGYGRLGWAKKVKHLGIQPSIYFDLPLREHDNETIH